MIFVGVAQVLIVKLEQIDDVRVYVGGAAVHQGEPARSFCIPIQLRSWLHVEVARTNTNSHNRYRDRYGFGRVGNRRGPESY
jgi:hypothetical protein